MIYFRAFRFITQLLFREQFIVNLQFPYKELKKRLILLYKGLIKLIKSRFETEISYDQAAKL